VHIVHCTGWLYGDRIPALLQTHSDESEVYRLWYVLTRHFRLTLTTHYLGTQLLLHPRRGTEVIQRDGLIETVYLSAIRATGDAPVLEASVVEAQFVESAWISGTRTYETRQRHGYTLAPNALPSKESLVRWAMECGWRTYARPWIAFSACYNQHNLPQVSTPSSWLNCFC
jgi:hypothetical protein